MSEKNAPVIQITMLPHPNADLLSVVKVDDFTCVVKTDDWVNGQLAVYIPPDSIVDTARPEFSFLDSNGSKVRIKAKRLRQVWSIGLLIPAPSDSKIGDNLYEGLGIHHYEPELSLCTGGNCVKTPVGMSDLSKYDIDNGRSSRYSRMFNDGELVYVTEKLHGANCSAVFIDNTYYVHSRTQWPEENQSSVHWKGVRSTPSIEKFCVDNSGYIVYGEVYGQVQKGYSYDCKPGEVKFRAFDIMNPSRQYLDVKNFLDVCDKYNIPTVPLVGFEKFDIDYLIALSERKSILNTATNAEGIVIKPMIERRDFSIGRTVIKLINPKYLEKN